MKANTSFGTHRSTFEMDLSTHEEEVDNVPKEESDTKKQKSEPVVVAPNHVPEFPAPGTVVEKKKGGMKGAEPTRQS